MLSSTDLRQPILGYLISTSACAAFFGVIIVAATRLPWINSHSFGFWIASAAVGFVESTFIAWIVASLTAWPFLMLSLYLRKLSSSMLIHFMVSGVIAAVCLDLLYAFLMVSVPHMGSDPPDMVYPSMGTIMVKLLPWLVLEGAIGGLTFWFVSVRSKRVIPIDGQ